MDAHGHGHGQHPWWKVAAIFDPDGEGGDFAYTIGLADEGVPELHLWARPSLGDDPGLDWRFSGRDLAQILNGLAWRLLADDLWPGETWEQTYDEGLAVVRFVVGDPERATDLEAYQAGDVPVLPVRWELRREAPGPEASMSPTAQRDADRLHATLHARVHGEPPAPGEEPWALGQPYGVRTSLVLLRAAQVRQADAATLMAACEHAMVLSRRRPPGYAIAVAATAGRGVGRGPAIAAARELGLELTSGLGETWGLEATEELRADFAEGLDAEESDEMWAFALAMLADAIGCLLAVEAAADLLPEDVVASGQGAYVCATGRDGLLAEQRYLCSPATADAVRSLIGGNDAAGERARSAITGATAAWVGERWSDELNHDLLALRLTGACHAPDVAELVPEVQRVGWVAKLAAADVSPVEVQLWADTLTTILERGDEAPAEAVEAFRSVSAGVPGLGRLLRRAGRRRPAVP